MAGMVNARVVKLCAVMGEAQLLGRASNAFREQDIQQM